MKKAGAAPAKKAPARKTAAKSAIPVAKGGETKPKTGANASEEPKTRGLTRRNAAFVAAFLKCRNATQAAISAGYSEGSARQQGARLMANADIRAEIDAHQAEVLERAKQETGVSLERTLVEIARIAFFDPRRLFGQDGEPLPITELDDETAAVIAGLDVLEEWEGVGENRRLVGHVKKWKLSDKKGALDMLMKHLGGYEVDNKQKTNPLLALLQRVGGKSALPVQK